MPKLFSASGIFHSRHAYNQNACNRQRIVDSTGVGQNKAKMSLMICAISASVPLRDNVFQDKECTRSTRKSILNLFFMSWKPGPPRLSKGSHWRFCTIGTQRHDPTFLWVGASPGNFFQVSRGFFFRIRGLYSKPHKARSSNHAERVRAPTFLIILFFFLLRFVFFLDSVAGRVVCLFHGANRCIPWLPFIFQSFKRFLGV